MNPRFSVLLPVRNGGEYLAPAIRSVIAQTFEDWELVVSDNCSTDQTAEVLSSFTDVRIKVVRLSHSLSMIENWNHVLHRARGRFGMLLGADDRLMPEHLESRVVLHERHSEAPLIAGSCHVIDEKGRRIREIQSLWEGWRSIDEILPIMLGGNPINILGASFCLAALREEELEFDTRFLLADWALWLELIVRRGGAAFSKSPTVEYRVHGDSATSAVSEGRWCWEAASMRQHFIDTHRTCLAEIGIDVEALECSISETLWLNAQQLVRCGQWDMAGKAWRLFRRHHSIATAIRALPSEVRGACVRRLRRAK